MDDFLRVYELLSLVALCNEMHGFYINTNKKNYQSLINAYLKKVQTGIQWVVFLHLKNFNDCFIG